MKKISIFLILILIIISGCTQMITTPVKITGAVLSTTIDVTGSIVHAVVDSDEKKED